MEPFLPISFFHLNISSLVSVKRHVYMLCRVGGRYLCVCGICGVYVFGVVCVCGAMWYMWCVCVCVVCEYVCVYGMFV